MRPEVQPQDIALVCQQVVADIQAGHRLQMRPHDPVDDERAHRGRVVAAMLQIVQDGGAHREPRLVAFVPPAHLRVQVPAVVVEARRVGDLPHLVHRATLQLPEPDDDVGDLHAHVVDVVLRLNRRAPKPQRPHQRVAQGGVAQVTDVRRLVRVDRRMLDDCFLRGRAVGLDLLPEARNEKRQPVEVQIQIAVGRRFDPSHAGSAADRLRQLLRDRARCLAERPRQLKGDRHGEIAHRAGRRHFHGERRHVGPQRADGSSLGVTAQVLDKATGDCDCENKN